MQRVDAQEILDSNGCSAPDVEGALAVLGRINRWFGGVATTRKMVQRVAQATELKSFSLLEVAAGKGEVPAQVRAEMARRGITLEVTLLDRDPCHLPGSNGGSGRQHLNCASLVANALALPFGDSAFDLVSCSLFAHHLNVEPLAQFLREGLRVSRRALLINDLVRHPMHLALVYASFPIMRNRVAWLDGITSVRRAYVPEEIQSILASALPSSVRMEVSRNYLFRMGMIVWKPQSP